MIKNVQFQHCNFSKVAKIMYKVISDASSVIFVPNLAEQSLEFDQEVCETSTNICTSSIMVVWIDLTLISVYAQYLRNGPNGSKVKMMFL